MVDVIIVVLQAIFTLMVIWGMARLGWLGAGGYKLYRARRGRRAVVATARSDNEELAELKERLAMTKALRAEFDISYNPNHDEAARVQGADPTSGTTT